MYRMAGLQVFVFLRLNGVYLSYSLQHCRFLLMGFASKDAMDRVRLIDWQRMGALV